MGNFMHCKDGIWSGDDFTKCFRRDYGDVFIPLLLITCSLLLLILRAVRTAWQSLSAHRYHPLLSTAEDEEDYASESEDEFDEVAPETDEQIEASEDKPWGRQVTVVLELLLALGLMGVHLAELILRTEGKWKKNGWKPIGGLIAWSYVAVVVLTRLFAPKWSRKQSPSLWYHTLLIYLLHLPIVFFEARSAVIHTISETKFVLILHQFAMVTGLCVIALTQRIGNEPVKSYSGGDLEPSTEPLASVFSTFTFSWVNAIIYKGFRKSLQMSDVWDLRRDDHAYQVVNAFRKTKRASSLAWTLIRFFDRYLWAQTFWALGYSLLTFAPVLCLKQILELVDKPEGTSRELLWLYIIGLFVGTVACSIGNGQALYIGRRICIRLRAIIIGEVYSKALRRRDVAAAAAAEAKDLEDIDKSKDDKDKKEETADPANHGAIINLMAVDAFKVAEICAYLHYLTAGVPIQIIVAIFLLYRVLGWSAIAGVASMFLLMPLNYYISRTFSKIQGELMAVTDKRINTMNEIMSSIRIIKYFAWEERFFALVDETRRAELKQLARRFTFWCFAGLVFYASPIIITLVTFFVYTKIAHQELTAPVAFTSLSLFNVLRIPLDQLADMLTNVLQSKVSLNRVEKFLDEEETLKYEQLSQQLHDEQGPFVGFKNANFTWASKAELEREGTLVAGKSAFQLRDLNVRFPSGALSLIVGPTGSGKSSLLMALLGEMTPIDGEVYLPGGGRPREQMVIDPQTGLTESVAYCAQQAWLLNDTIRNNILFASPYNKKRYSAVIRACALTRDLEILNAGDQTEVGDKGIALSGGQKQRISLARALYSNSRYILLDDCLSAVDSHTAQWIYANCILGKLMDNRTQILVTHNVSLCLPGASHVVVMDNGVVKAQGTPEQMVDLGVLADDEELLKASVSRDPSRATSRLPSRAPSVMEINEVIEEQEGARHDAMEAKKDEDKHKAPVMLTQEETKTEGSVSREVYFVYAKAMGGWGYWMLLLLCFLLCQLVNVSQSYWIRKWAASYDTADSSAVKTTYASKPVGASRHVARAETQISFSTVGAYFHQETPLVEALTQSIDLNYYLGVYAALAFAYMIATFMRMAVVFYGSWCASGRLYNDMLHAVMSAKVRFFDSTPLGRIMNRFSKDIETVDQELAVMAMAFFNDVLSVTTVVILITVITPGFLIAGVFITILYVVIGVLYLRTSRELKRLESISKSPIYQHFGETLAGISTIRAYGEERRFIRDNLKKVDGNNRPFFYLWVTNRWLSIRVDAAGALVAFFAGVLIALNLDRLDAGLAGLSLTYAITFTEHMLWVVRLYAVNEMNFNSVERIREYLHVEQEASKIVENHRPPSDWPQKGTVMVKDLELKYAPELPPVIKGVSFDVPPASKVGICGRTGAGKSTIASAFFRFLEPTKGSITIDGVDISTIGLTDLRNALTIIPQDPTLFAGTIRSNLDPFNHFSDEQVAEALRRVHLVGDSTEADGNGINANVFEDLSSAVSEGGGNLSQGQRQLMCVARSLLKAPRLILMDEATASIDFATDAKIQTTIRSEFSGSTILTIAHRLRSIIDYDKVMVLDHGELKEYDHPHVLIQDEGSIFRSMCEQSGEFEALREMAEEAYRKSQVDEALLVDIHSAA
ncbi:hypothetical protein SAICODRAFT_93382 [Saitoella complicata NRRL Y-17804]|nr:uncharacterized protein SAICODRAFT_93382 [Saitoella complicata NRRL Y-17804]ODQ52501.1 hypothetical protein SAICODRAFT_93382 [Saitoella complicata NRRL Y-17804]